MFKIENFNLLNKIRDSVNEKVNESRIPTEDFESTVGIYGGKMETEDDNKLVWNNEGIISKIDKFGDKDLYLKGLPLQDLYRADLINSDKVEGFDRFQALAESGKYLRRIHDEHGGIGEVLAGDIIFKNHEDGKVGEQILNMPDIVFNKKKNIGEKEKKTIDILDFIMSIGAEEFRRSEGDFDSVKRAMSTILENYNDKAVIRLVKSYIKRGRLTMLGDKTSSAVNLPEDNFTTKNRGIFTKHNEARVINDKDLEASLKSVGLEVCEETGQEDESKS
jgi:hypothetical protein